MDYADHVKSAMGMKINTDALIVERGKTHGDYSVHAKVAQDIEAVIEIYATPKHNHMMRESLHMIAHKIGRIMAGDPDFRDHWDDIAGYAKLVADRCTK